MNKEFRPDVIWFNSFIITVLCVFAVILVRFEALNIFLLLDFLVFFFGGSAFIYDWLAAGAFALGRCYFCYGSYLIYAVIISKEMTTVDPLDVAWLF